MSVEIETAVTFNVFGRNCHPDRIFCNYRDSTSVRPDCCKGKSQDFFKKNLVSNVGEAGCKGKLCFPWYKSRKGEKVSPNVMSNYASQNVCNPSKKRKHIFFPMNPEVRSSSSKFDHREFYEDKKRRSTAIMVLKPQNVWSGQCHWLSWKRVLIWSHRTTYFFPLLRSLELIPSLGIVRDVEGMVSRGLVGIVATLDHEGVGLAADHVDLGDEETVNVPSNAPANMT